MAPIDEKTYRQLVIQRRLFLTINVVATISFGVLFYFIHQQNITIQQQRRESIMRMCESQNSRNKNTIDTLNELVRKLPSNKRNNVSNTILLINALVPKQNCNKLVAKSVKP